MNRAALRRLVGVLGRARVLLSDKERWCAGAIARDAYGNPLDDPRDGRASAWDIAGAILALTSGNLADATMKLLPDSFWQRQDEGGHAEALRILDNAIGYWSAELLS